MNPEEYFEIARELLNLPPRYDVKLQIVGDELRLKYIENFVPREMALCSLPR